MNSYYSLLLSVDLLSVLKRLISVFGRYGLQMSCVSCIVFISLVLRDDVGLCVHKNGGQWKVKTC